MAEIFNFRAFQKARDEGNRMQLGPNVMRAVAARVREEQRAGKSGNDVAGDLAMARMRMRARGSDPKDAA